MVRPGHACTRATARLLQRASQRRRLCRGYATELGLHGNLPYVGEEIHGFTLKRNRHVPEFELSALHFTHNKTGAEYLHIVKDDKNNVFSIGFKTNPPDHTGLPHILEHLSLCGSKRFPVRDPFFKMMPRSLNNFMNAMTYPDHTVYPFATTNARDFKNLMSVYLDATLNPLLRQQDFAQEGWRVGLPDPRAPLSPENELMFKGVVYNEMKGNMSNADYLFNTRWQNHVLPSLNDSGGDPAKMTDLTHEMLTKFHASHYTPSNAKILTYGNLPYDTHMAMLDSYLSNFEPQNIDSEIKMPIDLTSGSQRVTVQGPSDPLYPKDQQWKASMTWMMGDTSDVVENFALGIISSLLLDGFSAPLYQNTMDVGWGAAYTPNTGLKTDGKVSMFTVGLSGLKKHDVSRLEPGIRNTLEMVKRQGFDEGKVRGRLHQIELALKHKNANFGMDLTSRLQDGWFYGTDPFKTVNPEDVIWGFHEEYTARESTYLIDLFEKYWLNGNTLTFVMEPVDRFTDVGKSEERTRLAYKISELSRDHTSVDACRDFLAKKDFALTEMQESGSSEDLSCLPTVHVSDISRQAERFDVRSSVFNETPVQWRETPTNGLTYFRAIQPLQDLPDDLRIYLPLFTTAVQRLGTKALPLEKFEDETRLRTGGIAIGHHAATSPLDLSVTSEGLSLSGTALDRNVPFMLELLRVAVQETDFTQRTAEDKISELIKSYASAALNDVSESGSSYALRFAQAGLSESARLTEETSGLTQVRLMMDLAGRAPRDGYSDVMEHLRRIQSFALAPASVTGQQLRVAITCSAEASEANERALDIFLDNLAAGTARATPAMAPPSTDPADQIPYPSNARTFFPLPFQNYHAARALSTVPFVHADSAPLAILAQLLTHKRLHPEVREKGGAYGASASLSSLRGVFGMASYRDPAPQASLDVMRSVGEWVSRASTRSAAGSVSSATALTDRDIEEAKLSIFQGVDAPRDVDQEGLEAFLHGVSPDMIQARRERLLDVSLADVRRVAEQYLVESASQASRLTNEVVLGPADSAAVAAGETSASSAGAAPAPPGGADAAAADASANGDAVVASWARDPASWTEMPLGIRADVTDNGDEGFLVL